MSISVILTIGASAYDVSNDVIRHSIEIDEYLFSPENLKPNTNKATLTLGRSCAAIDDIFAATGDIGIAITSDTVPAFAGYLTDNYALKITARGGSDVQLTAEDPGIKLLKKPWVSTGGLFTNLSGKKVCDPADTGNSALHIIAGLAGATVAAGAPTVSSLVYFSVQDKDKKQYWDILEKMLYDYGYAFYFNASGQLALFSLAGLTGSPSLVVRSDATILQKSLGDAGIEIKKRFIQYQEAIVNYKEAETLASAVVFRDTTGQGLTDCVIEIAAGGYYPASADASTYAYIDYFLEDGRDILAVGTGTADFVVDSGITSEFTHLGKSAQIRFYNPTALPKSIRRLKVTGGNVIAVKAQSSMTSNTGGGKKLEYDADYLTANADALALANLLRYVYANSTSLYTFRAYGGVLYPADTLYPSDTLYPLGDTLALGSLVNLKDPVWTSLDVNCAIYRKKYTPGKAGATFEALGIGTINLADAAVRLPVAQPVARPIVGLYPTEKAIASTSDPVDFEGQYGVYLGRRYVGTMPTTWALDDAGQTAAQVADAVPVNVPRYLGPVKDGTPSYAKEGDVYLLYSETANTVTPPTLANPPDHRGVFKYTSSAWAWTQDPADILKAARDIVEICSLHNTANPPAALYGEEADYGITESIDVAHIKAALIDILRVGDITIAGTLKSSQMDTVNAQAGETIAAPTPSYWPGSDLVTHCTGLADGWHAATGTLGVKTITHVVKGGASNAVAYQASDAEAVGALTTLKTITSGVRGKCTIFLDVKKTGYDTGAQIRVNGIVIASYSITSYTYSTVSVTTTLSIGDTVTVYASSMMQATVQNFRLCPAVNTIGAWNSTDPSAYSFDIAGYYNDAGNIDVDVLTNFVTANQDIYWKGSELIALLSGKVTSYKTVALGGGTFNSKTCATIYYSPSVMQLNYASGTSDVIHSESYYTYAGSIVLDTVDGKVLIGDETADGQYEQWVHNIPGSTDLIITWRNIVTGAIHSITETRAPDRASGSIEATHSLHAVHNSVDHVRDLSLHNYSGSMHGLDVLSNFTNDTLGDWKWYGQRRVVAWQGSTAYSVGDLVYNNPDGGGINKVYICTYVQGTGTSSASGGPTGTGVYINDGSYPNDVIWQYVGVETEAGNGIWGDLKAQMYSLSGGLYLKNGQKPTGTLFAASYTQDQIYQAIAPALPLIGNSICVHGMLAGYTVSHAIKTDFMTITFYGATGSAVSGITCGYGSASTRANVSLSW